MGREQTLART